MNLRKSITIVGLLVLPVLLSACGTRYPASQATPADTARITVSLPNEIGRFLSEGQDFQRQVINFAAWGDELELELQPAYFAASGRICRPFILYSQTYFSAESAPESFLESMSAHQESTADTRLACEIRHSHWEEVRHILRGAQ